MNTELNIEKVAFLCLIGQPDKASWTKKEINNYTSIRDVRPKAPSYVLCFRDRNEWARSHGMIHMTSDYIKRYVRTMVQIVHTIHRKSSDSDRRRPTHRVTSIRH